jgi:hypothetical protein
MVRSGLLGARKSSILGPAEINYLKRRESRKRARLIEESTENAKPR